MSLFEIKGVEARSLYCAYILGTLCTRDFSLILVCLCFAVKEISKGTYKEARNAYKILVGKS
jgi:hypothetical protein